jgi:ribosomal protein S18 acetylase RimI-like enzyme
MATARDAPFLAQMLALAAGWRGSEPRSVGGVLDRPELARYVDRWPRLGDVGVVALDARGEPVGAAWWRFFRADDPGYGFVDEHTPELTIGVVADARGEGIGRALLDALIAEARSRQVRALSLSVEPDNPARLLYERVGFVVVGRDGGAQTMLVACEARPGAS